MSYGAPRACLIRIVHPETGIEQPAGAIGEIWVHGDNVAQGYWRKPEQSARTFGERITTPSAGTPAAPWLRTGDLGVISKGELYIIGRLKDLLIVDGRNHYPDDIEATIQEITGGRVAAIAVEDDDTENLVAIIELKQRGSDDEHAQRLDTVKREVTTAIWRVTQSSCRRPRAGVARFDPDHHQRQDPPVVVCGAVSSRASSNDWTSRYDVVRRSGSRTS